jgi:acetyl-CoA carboxylase carboxyltransferase component
MPVLDTRLDPHSEAFATNRAHMLRLLGEVRALEQRTRDRSAQSKPLFDKRGQLLPRDRIALLLDPASSFLELSALAGFGMDHPDPARCVPGAGVITGIGSVAGTRCMVVASDAGIEAGSIRAMGLEKMLRAQQLALENRLPFVHLAESAGANLLRYKVDGFVRGGAIFRNLARLSAAGLPVVTVVHGSSTAGGAYMPGLSDYVVMVRGRARAFLAGPPLLKAATGEIATEEDLGGADMHASVSGLGEYLAEDDADGVRLAREVVQHLHWQRHLTPVAMAATARPPRLDAEELLGILSADGRKPADMREVIARIVDGSRFHEYQPAYGTTLVCGYANIWGYKVGILANNGVLFNDSALKGAHFIELCNQNATPLVFLQNITGYMVGREYEARGITKDGAKMIMAQSCSRVPKFPVMCHGSFGAGNYGMCGRAFDARFMFAWPNHQIGVMGGEQAARTLAEVKMRQLERNGQALDEAVIDGVYQETLKAYQEQLSAYYSTSELWDDGIIDPRDTRNALGIAISASLNAPLGEPGYGVLRF